MFDKLVDFILNFFDHIFPCFIIHQYEQGILYRYGKVIKVLHPGLCWKIPFIDSYDKKAIITTTLTIPTQSLTTKDQKQVVIKSVVKYSIIDIKLFLTEVYDSVDAISDITQCIIKEQIINKEWVQCLDNDLDNVITKKLRLEVKRWGIDIEKVTLTDIGIIRSIRLFNENLING